MLVSAWDQMGSMQVASPAVAVAEKVAAGWALRFRPRMALEHCLPEAVRSFLDA